MRNALLLALILALLSAANAPGRAQPGVPGGPEGLRGVVVATEGLEAATVVAFTDALLDELADRNEAQATLLTPQAALCRAAGIQAEHFVSLSDASAELAGMLLLDWARQLRLAEVGRVTLTATSQRAQAELLVGRPAWGQARRTVTALDQPLTQANAPLLAGKVAQAFKGGWDSASPVASTGLLPAVTPPTTPAPPTTTVTTPPPPPAPPTPDGLPETAAPPPPPADSPLLAAAEAKLREGDMPRALDLITQALQAGENATQAYLLRARIYATLQAPDLQREALTAAIAGDKTLYGPRLQLAALERDRGLWQNAVTLYREAIAAQPDQAAAYVSLAALLNDRRRPAEALRTLQEGVAASPKSVSLLFVLAKEYQRRGALPAAEETYAKIAALAEGPEKARALQELGRIYVEANQYSAAFDVLREAADQAPSGVAELYKELFVACDKAVAQALQGGFAALEAMGSPAQPLPREEVFQRLTTAERQISKIEAFAAPLEFSGPEQSVLQDRQLYYSRALEALTYALEYVDTGNAAAKTAALERRREAEAMPAGWGG